MNKYYYFIIMISIFIYSCNTVKPFIPIKNSENKNETYMKYRLKYDKSFLNSKIYQGTNEISYPDLEDLYKNTSVEAYNTFKCENILRATGAITCSTGAGFILYKMLEARTIETIKYDAYFWSGLSLLLIGNVLLTINIDNIDKAINEYNKWLSNELKISISYNIINNNANINAIYKY